MIKGTNIDNQLIHTRPKQGKWSRGLTLIISWSTPGLNTGNDQGTNIDNQLIHTWPSRGKWSRELTLIISWSTSGLNKVEMIKGTNTDNQLIHTRPNRGKWSRGLTLIISWSTQCLKIGNDQGNLSKLENGKKYKFWIKKIGLFNFSIKFNLVFFF